MASFGEELRRERELRGISLREVAEATKVNIRFLEAMERNDFGVLHGGLYNRGIVRAYCKFIGADPEAMVNAYLLEERSRSERRQGGDAGLLRGRPGTSSPSRPVDASDAGPRPPWGRWALLVLVLAALVASVLLYIRFIDAGDPRPVEPKPRVRAADLIRAGGRIG